MTYRIEGDEKKWDSRDGGLTAPATACEIEFWAEIVRLRSLLNKQGDDLCWITDHASMRASPLPKQEMLESCRRYVDQLHEHLPTLEAGQMTIAQLEDRVAELETKVARIAGARELLTRLRATQCCDPVIDGMIGAMIERFRE